MNQDRTKQDQPKASGEQHAKFALLFSGSLLVVSGFIHLILFVFQSGDWEGPLSLRKPILFGLSTGVTLLSIAWIQTRLETRRWKGVLAWSLSLSLVAEVALITMQQWRDVASHFNHATTFDSRVEIWMNILIVVATIILMEYTRRCFQRIKVPADQKLAIRGGMVLLMISCAIGFLIFFHGTAQVSAGKDPSRVGENGVAKFPHGIAIHAIQFFPLLCWMMQRVGIRLPSRIRLVRLAIGSMVMFLIFSVVQTVTGRSRFDLNIFGGTLLLFAFLLILPIVRSFGAKLIIHPPRSKRRLDE